MEKWKEIKDYEGLFLISSYGRVKSIQTKQILKPSITERDKVIIGLSKNGISKNHIVSRFVAFAFVPNPDNKPCVDHKDGVRFHNFAENLRWCTVAENNNFELARKNKLKNCKKVEGFGRDGKKVLEFENLAQASKMGFNRVLIQRSIEKKVLFKGILYKYAENTNKSYGD